MVSKKDFIMPYEHIPPGLRVRQPMIRHIQPVNRFAWSPDGRYLAVPSNSQAIGIWDTSTMQRVQTLTGHTGSVYDVSWSPDGTTLASVAADGTVRLWHPLENRTIKILGAHSRALYAVAWFANGNLLASGSADGIIHLWNPHTRALVSTLRSESLEPVYALAWSPVEAVLASGSAQEILLWSSEASTSPRTLVQQAPSAGGNVSQTYALAWSSDGRLLASGSADRTIRLWEPESERLVRILEGHHTGVVTSLSFSCDDRLLASKARDKKTCIWRTDTWKLAAEMKERSLRLPWSSSLAFHPHTCTLAIAEDEDRKIGLWDVDLATMQEKGQDVSIYYTNAKIALVGDSGVGKSSLGQVLAGRPFVPVASTHGREVWLFDAQEVSLDGGRRETRETLLWDLAGQPGYRLIHQLHLSEVSVALIVFDSYSETDPFAGVHHWVRALDVAHRVQGMGKQPMTKFLIAARIDRRGRGRHLHL
jgi:WD40 repeat protein